MVKTPPPARRWIAAATACLVMAISLSLYLSPAYLPVPPRPRPLVWSLCFAALLLLAAAEPLLPLPMKSRHHQMPAEPLTESLAGAERTMLTWMWFLAVGVAVPTALAGDAAIASPPLTASYLMAFCLYWTVSTLRVGRFAEVQFRIAAHFTFASLSLSCLLTAPGQIGEFAIAPLAAILALSLYTTGTALIRLVAVGCALIVTAGNCIQWLTAQCSFGLAVVRSLVEVAMLVWAVEVGLHLSSVRRQLIGDLIAVRAELEESHADLQSAHEELQAQNEELLAQNEQLRNQQELLECQREQLQHVLATAQLNEQLFRKAFTNAPIGMLMVTPEGTISQVNLAFCRMVGYSESELIGKAYRSLIHPDDLPRAEEKMRMLREGEVDSYTIEKRYLLRDGRSIWVLLSASIIRETDTTPAYRIGQVMDITALKRYQQELLRMARYDALTDLLNRRAFQEAVDQYLAEAAQHQSPAALIYMDLDQFKFVNDNMGHQAGDQLLQGIARLLRREMRSTDVVARLGGDEFAAFLPHTPPDKALEVARRLLEAVRRHVEVVAGKRISTTASIGIASFPGDGQTSQELLSAADLAMYMAKDAGRNQLCASDPTSPNQELMVARLSWEQRIREALEQDRFVLYWQPIRNLNDPQIRQYELLLRMVDKDGAVIPPAAFLETAERFGSIHAIDRWVVKKAIALLAEHQQMGSDICLEVNLSGRAFEDPQLLPMIREEFERTGVNPQNLILEITETAAIKDLDMACQFIETLRALGCRFAIDDFGTGFASLYYVKRLPVDYLKIDGSFITNLPRDPVDQQLVRAMVGVAQGLGKKTVAEFVSDEETVQLLQELGVDFAQGYHIGKPRPLDV